MKRQAIQAKRTDGMGCRRGAVLLCLCVLWGTVLLMSGCVVPLRRPTAAVTVLTAMTAVTGDGWPQGAMYDLTAPPESKEALSSTMISALYGEAARRWLTGDTPPVCDAAIFLSTTLHPAELAVFRCADEETAGAVAAVCRSRLEIVREHWGEEAHAAWVANATVSVKGDYVLLVVANDPEPLIRAAAAAI